MVALKVPCCPEWEVGSNKEKKAIKDNFHLPGVVQRVTPKCCLLCLPGTGSRVYTNDSQGRNYLLFPRVRFGLRGCAVTTPACQNMTAELLCHRNVSSRLPRLLS